MQAIPYFTVWQREYLFSCIGQPLVHLTKRQQLKGLESGSHHVVVSPIFLLALEVLGQCMIPIDVFDVGNGGIVLKLNTKHSVHVI